MNYSNPFLVLYSCTSVLCCLNSCWGTERVFRKLKNRCKFVCIYERSFKWSYQCPQDSCTSKCQSYSQHVWLGGIRSECCISISTNHWKREKSNHQNNLYLTQCLFFRQFWYLLYVSWLYMNWNVNTKQQRWLTFNQLSKYLKRCNISILLKVTCINVI